MKIDLVLTACDLSDNYLKLYPHVHRIWKEKFGLICKLILISANIPDFLKKYEDDIILFPPIPEISATFIAQVIRILYPCLFANQCVLITDVDIFPISNDYFIKSIESIPDNYFVSYRDAYLKQKMLSICYNAANGTVWKEIFGINHTDDIIATLKSWYNHDYTGKKNCPGWFTDQKKLYEYATEWKSNREGRLVILYDKNLKFNRLDKRHRVYIINNITNVVNGIKQGIYTDFHCIKPYQKYSRTINSILNAI